MKKFLFLFLILFSPVFLLSCGTIDFTKAPGSAVLSLFGIGFSDNGKAPNAPANLQSTPIATEQIDLVWENNSNNTTGFRIERSATTNTNFIEIAGSIPGGAASYNDAAGLAPGTTYYYRLRAFNAAGNSEYSNITSAATFTSTPLVPANPSILQATAVSGSQVDLTWNDNSDNETGFSVERRAPGETGFTEIASGLSAGTTLYRSTGLNPQLTYYFRVRAFNNNGYSGYSNDAAISICPAPPTDVTVSATSSSQITVSWNDNSSNETGFRIERSSVTNANYAEIAGNLPAGTTSYSNSGLNYNTTYYYRVRAYNTFGNSGYSNESSATTNNIIPYAPSGLAATADSSSRINITWNDNSDNESSFIIERSVNNVTFTQIATVTSNTTVYSDTGLSAATTYYYRVRAHNGMGDSGNSNVSSAMTYDVIPAAPSNCTASALSSTQINLSWSDNSSNETSFIIQRSMNNIDFSQIATVGTNVTSYSDTGLTASTTYYYRVCAHNSIGDSAYTGVAQATTPPNSTATQIIANHTIVANYTNIPQRWIDEVKKMWVNIPGESHSQAYRTGLTLLMQQDSRFAASVVESGNPEVYTNLHLRASKAVRTQYSSWSYSTGEDVWYTWHAASPWGTNKDVITNHISYSNSNGFGQSVIGFGWCWDMTWHNDPGGTLDPVYHVHWAGSSVGGPNGDMRWGLDSGDNSLTGNSVSMDTYLNATEVNRLFCLNNGYQTKVIFTTGPVDSYSGENGYQRHLKHEFIRNFVNANADRILFDYADILCYDDNGNQNIVSWTDSVGTVHSYPIITTTNVGDASVGHIGSAGALRLAKAQWWMLARIAGWNGVSN